MGAIVPPLAARRDIRERLIAGLAVAVADRGYEATTVEDIIAAASVVRRTFYKHFSDKQDCFLAAVDTFSAALREQVEAAVAGEEDWTERIRLGLAALLEVLAREPDLARLCIVEPTFAGGEIAARQLKAFGELAPALSKDRPPRPDGRPVPADVDAAVIGGVVSTIGARINAGEAGRLPELLPPLLEFALTPYLGSAEAEQVALRAAPRSPS